MTKIILVVYMVSILGTGNGVNHIEKHSTFENMQECQQAVKTLIVKDFGNDVSGRVVAYCAAQDIKGVKID
jgi:hypothetical protein